MLKQTIAGQHLSFLASFRRPSPSPSRLLPRLTARYSVQPTPRLPSRLPFVCFPCLALAPTLRQPASSLQSSRSLSTDPPLDLNDDMAPPVLAKCAKQVLDKEDGPLVWIDCEMTGLDLATDRLLEVRSCVLPVSSRRLVIEGSR